MNNQHVHLALIGTMFLISSLIINASDATNKQESIDQKRMIVTISEKHKMYCPEREGRACSVCLEQRRKAHPISYEYLPQIPLPAVRKIIGDYAKKLDVHIVPFSSYKRPADQTVLQRGTFKFGRQYDENHWSFLLQTADATPREITVIYNSGSKNLSEYFKSEEGYYATAVRYSYNPVGHTGQILLDRTRGEGTDVVPFVPCTDTYSVKRTHKELKQAGFVTEDLPSF